MNNPFTEDYYLRGVELGISNYHEYRWMPDLTIPMAMTFVRSVLASQNDTVLEVGCARGFFVKALRFLGVPAWGYDISEWAVQNCHPDVAEFVSTVIPEGQFDWVFGKDQMEHVRTEDIHSMLLTLFPKTKKGMFFIVPLAKENGGEYVYPNDELDSTHVQRLTLEGWMKLFLQSIPPEFELHGSYHIEGLKPASKNFPFSCGFFTIKRRT